MAVSLLSVDALKAALREPEPPAVVDARPYGQYLRGHVPGAVWIGWEDWCAEAPEGFAAVLEQPGYWGLFGSANPAKLADHLSELGLAHDKPIVVYANGAASKGREGRIAWMLLYAGAQEVRLLTAGYDAWVDCGGPEQTLIAPRLRATRFIVSFHERRRAMLDRLKEAAQRGRLPTMLDTRTPPEFIGDLYRYMPRMGRMPNALLVSYPNVFDRAGQNFLSREDFLQAIPRAVHDNADVVAYCEVGVRASTVALLWEAYTGQIMPVYDGSMMEWSTCMELPVERR